MTTTENANFNSVAPSTSPVLVGTFEYIIVRCDVHGSKFTSDFDSARLYVEAAWACKDEVGILDHDRWHYEVGHACWVDGPCCVVDPHGMFDY